MHLSNRLPMKLDTEPRELVARLVPAPEPLSAHICSLDTGSTWVQ
jgi:hypothetical protein